MGQELAPKMRELDERQDSFGNLVRILHDPGDSSVHLNILTDDSGLDVKVPSDKARDAFEHPYSYAAAAGEAGRLLVESLVNDRISIAAA